MKNAEQVEGLVDEREQAATEALLRWRRRVCYGMTEILPNLYLGSMRDANDADQLNEKQIQYIVSIHGLTRSPTTLSNSNASVLHIHMADLPEANISEHFQEAITFIHHARLQNRAVLVHCLAGVSRSVCVVAAYLIVTCELTYAAAMSYITSKRPCANPNFGFRMQLAEYQKKGCTERLVISNHFDSQKMDELKQNDMRILLDYPATMLPSADLSNSSSDNSHDGFTTYASNCLDLSTTAKQTSPIGSCTSVRGSQNNNTARTLLNTSDISFIDQ